MAKQGTDRKQVFPVYLSPEQLGALRRLSAATRVSIAAYLREGVDDLLRKYAKELRKESKR